MARRAIAFWALIVFAVLAFTASVDFFVNWSQYQYLLAGLTPLRMPVPDTRGSEFAASFEAVWSEPHYVALVFDARHASPELADLFARAHADVGSLLPQRAAFDFEWRVVDGETVVGRGTGRARVAGESGTERDLGFIFGEVRLRAGRRYRLIMSPGATFSSLFPASPVVEVGVARPGPSLGLALGRDIDGPACVVCALLAFVSLLAAWVVRRRGQGRHR